ncbi:MAG: TetR/AcrR family transcriptional regulator [Rhodothermaceae bacterium]|nr:TetR/AcrR family transcriptional regulator [Rhodothermaceae bacterium]
MPRTKSFDPAEVLDRAADLFWARGYESVSIQDLVDHLGLSRSSLYETFGDKQHLYLAALDRYRRAAGGRMLADLNASSPKAGIRRHFERMMQEALDQHGRWGCFMTNATIERGPLDPETDAVTQASRDAMIAAFEQTIRRAQRAGEIPKAKNALALARFLAGAVYGLRTLARSGAGRPTLADFVNVTIGALD